MIEKVFHESFACYDTKAKRPVQLTDHTWASLLAAGLIHSWKKNGAFDCSKSGVITQINIRPWVNPSLHLRCVSNYYSRILPTAGAFSLDEALGAVTGRLRASMT
jgi:hypothetical protein